MTLEENFNPRVSDVYRTQLIEIAGGDERGIQLTDPLSTWSFAKLPRQAGESIPYVRLGDARESERPILFVSGFTGGILDKAPLAVDLAKRGHEVIVVGENRNGLLANALGKKDATLTQAVNFLAVLSAEGLDSGPNSVDVITHSYGSLIFDAMHKLAEDRGLSCFKGSNVVMLDPAGFIKHEWLVRLGLSFGRNAVAETFSEKDFPDPDGSALKAGIGYAMANKPRTAREVWDISRRQVDYERLLRSEIGQLAIISYAESRVFPTRAQRKTIANMFAIEDSSVPFTWSTAVSLQRVENGAIRSGRDATHNDDQFNPARVGGAISQLLTR